MTKRCYRCGYVQDEDDWQWAHESISRLNEETGLWDRLLCKDCYDFAKEMAVIVWPSSNVTKETNDYSLVTEE